MLFRSALPFIKFHENHGLLQIFGRPKWETVSGGSITYVRRLAAAVNGELRLGVGVASVRRHPGGVEIQDSLGRVERFDHAVIASHADEALTMLSDATRLEQELLRTFQYRRNKAVLHSDSSLMPRRRSAWASWNYVENAGQSPFFTYWMNRQIGRAHV